MDEVDEASQVVRVGLGQDAVAEVEDVARPAARPREDPAGLLGDGVARAEQESRVEVALDGAVGDQRPALVERRSASRAR